MKKISIHARVEGPSILLAAAYMRIYVLFHHIPPSLSLSLYLSHSRAQQPV